MRDTTFKTFAGTTMADARTETSRRGRKAVGRKYPELVRVFDAPASDATLDEAPAPEPENAPSYRPPTP
jgi:hypothetical protein